MEEVAANRVLSVDAIRETHRLRYAYRAGKNFESLDESPLRYWLSEATVWAEAAIPNSLQDDQTRHRVTYFRRVIGRRGALSLSP